MTEQAMAERGIVTLCDAHYFDGLLMLHRSVRECFPVPIACYDLGLTPSQKDAAASLDQFVLLPLPDDPLVHRIRDVMGRSPPLAKPHKRVWPLWICPILIREAPFRDVLWLDCDLVVLRNLDRLFDAIEEGPVFTPENKAPDATPNKPRLYELLPIARSFDPMKPTVNAGVSGWRKSRDAAVISAYVHAVSCATDDPELRAAISWHDQGALIWAIQMLGLEDRVLAGNEWNLCVENSAVAGRQIAWDEHFLERLRREVPEANVLHWNGCPPPWAGQGADVAAPVSAAVAEAPGPATEMGPAAVGAYYDAWTERYIAAFGDTFQACRTQDVNDLHRFVMDRAELMNGQRILDAGCGVCGPSSYFASQLEVRIDAVTVSAVQVGIARERLRMLGLQDRVHVHLGDFNELGSLLPAESFDRVVFLESLSHATDPGPALRSAMAALKPGGLVFIKDFFARDGETEEETRWIRTVQRRVNEAFAVKTPFLQHTLDVLRDIGFGSPAVEPIPFEIDGGAWSAFNAAHQFDLYRGGRPVQWTQWISVAARKPADANRMVST